ncbi:hypothetical protein B0H14DRAFT_3150616 [Mycena olivaceomarginata]|nr:hypothetical protein B0H14DRAFT_3150616 [Mycena olivaceomarginata]
MYPHWIVSQKSETNSLEAFVRPLSGKSAFLNRERARDTPTTMAKLQGGSVLSALLGQRTDTSSNGGEPDSGRRLLSSAIEAGIPKGQITTSATRSTFVLQHHGGSRLVELEVGGPRPLVYVCLYCLGTRVCDAGEPGRDSRAWKFWGAQPDAWFPLLHGEILCRKG